ncbi:MAG: ferrous iron transport protein A [Rhodobacteraceae bacterium]|nr:ferrous iron transport protein A [Paracoccaceae bacterium]
MNRTTGQFWVDQSANPVAVTRPLGAELCGFSGRVLRVSPHEARHDGALSHDEMERRLIELGFVEGARVRILHEGLFGRDPIAVRVNDVTVALRRREAMSIFVA